MPAFEFDVDASIAAGWDRFASRLADLLRDLIPGATFDLAVPVFGAPSPLTPFIRFTAVGQRRLEAEVSGGGSDDAPAPLRPAQLAQLAALGWRAADAEATAMPTPGPQVALPTDRATELTHLVAGTLEQVFGIRHPVFLHDVADVDDPDARAAASGPDPADASAARPGGPTEPHGSGDEDDFRPQPITDPDQATRAVGAALAAVYRRRMHPDEHDVFTVPAGWAVSCSSCAHTAPSPSSCSAARW